MVIGAILITLMSWGLAPVFDGHAARNASALRIMFWGAALGSLYVLVAGLIFGGSLEVDRRLIAFAMLGELGSLLGWLAYFRALSEGRTSDITAVASAYPLAAIAFLFLLGQGTSTPIVIGALLIVTGLVFIQFDNRALPEVGLRPFVIALLAACFWGLWVAAEWKALQYGGPGDVLLWSVAMFALFVFTVGLMARRREGTLRLPGAAWKPLVVGILIVKTGTVAFIFALKYGDPSLVVALSATYPLITLLASVVRRDETLGLNRLLAISLIASGAALAEIG